MFTLLYIVFVLLNISDIATTCVGMKDQGARELNPLLSYMFKKIGILSSLLIMKLLFLGFILLSVSQGWVSPMTMSYLLTGLNVFYIAIVTSNLLILKRLSLKGE